MLPFFKMYEYINIISCLHFCTLELEILDYFTNEEFGLDIVLHLHLLPRFIKYLKSV